MNKHHLRALLNCLAFLAALSLCASVEGIAELLLI